MHRSGRRSLTIRIAVLGTALATVLAACSSAATPAPTAAPTAAPSVAAKGLVNLAQDAKLGAYLTGADGKSLYLFTKDGKDKSTATAAVIANWPPLLVGAATDATAGAGVTGSLATIKRDDATSQVTYNGIPLYYYIKDTKAGDIAGQALNGVWFLVAPASTAASGTITGGVGQTAGATAAPSPTTGAQASSAPASATSVSISSTGFSPASLTVTTGATVTWTNTDKDAHTVTATGGGTFDSNNIAGGATYKQTFNAPGTVTYMCVIHPEMTGKITVTDAYSY
jgi:plastocyanin/predicted lipoprotein with Yx(FWY)xxD motif